MEYYTVMRMNKLSLHATTWNNITNMMLNGKKIVTKYINMIPFIGSAKTGKTNLLC